MLQSASAFIGSNYFQLFPAKLGPDHTWPECKINSSKAQVEKIRFKSWFDKNAILAQLLCVCRNYESGSLSWLLKAKYKLLKLA